MRISLLILIHCLQNKLLSYMQYISIIILLFQFVVFLQNTYNPTPANMVLHYNFRHHQAIDLFYSAYPLFIFLIFSSIFTYRWCFTNEPGKPKVCIYNIYLCIWYYLLPVSHLYMFSCSGLQHANRPKRNHLFESYFIDYLM